MSERYKIIDSSIPTFVTLTIVDWIDLFMRRRYMQVLDESLTYCIEHKGLKVHAYVYMTSHLHFIISSEGEELQNILRDFKKFTSKKLIETIKEIPESRREWLLDKFSFNAQVKERAKNYKVWQDGFHPVILDNGSKISQRIKYIHDNPVETGLVNHEKDWANSSYLVYEEDGRCKPNFEIDKLY